MTFQVRTMKEGVQGPEWAEARYGVTVIPHPGGSNYQVAELIEQEGSSIMEFWVVDKEGDPAKGLRIVEWHLDADPEMYGPLPGAGWRANGMYTFPTNSEGRSDMPMGGGSYTDPGVPGPHEAWMAGQGQSDKVVGIGMHRESEHRRLNVVWRETAGSTGPLDGYDGTRYFDGNELTAMQFVTRAGAAHVAKYSAAPGEEYLAIAEVHLMPRISRVSRTMCKNADGGARGGVPIKWDSFIGDQGHEIGVVNSDPTTGRADQDLGGQGVEYAVSGPSTGGPMRIRVHKAYPFNGDQLVQTGIIRIHGDTNKVPDVVFEIRVGAAGPDPVGDPPPVPTGLECTLGTREDGVFVSWSGSDEAESYSVHRKADEVGAQWQVVANVEPTEYLDTFAPIGKLLLYAITATNEFGESGYTNGVYGAVAGGDIDPPPDPIIDDEMILLLFEKLEQIIELLVGLNAKVAAERTYTSTITRQPLPPQL